MKIEHASKILWSPFSLDFQRQWENDVIVQNRVKYYNTIITMATWKNYGTSMLLLMVLLIWVGKTYREPFWESSAEKMKKS